MEKIILLPLGMLIVLLVQQLVKYALTHLEHYCLKGEKVTKDSVHIPVSPLRTPQRNPLLYVFTKSDQK